jgi:rhodanese-related sulfurtransferase
MRRICFITLMLAILCGSFSLAVAASNIDAQAAQRLLKERRDVYLLDVRTPGEYQQMRLADAHLIPIDQVTRRIDEIPKNRPVIIYCAVGSRSAQVFNFLARKGYQEVYNLDGGIYAWAQRGLPVLQGRP